VLAALSALAVVAATSLGATDPGALVTSSYPVDSGRLTVTHVPSGATGVGWAGTDGNTIYVVTGHCPPGTPSPSPISPGRPFPIGWCPGDLRTSADAGKTWSAPVPIGNVVYTRINANAVVFGGGALQVLGPNILLRRRSA
jgi:hypothetical protein